MKTMGIVSLVGFALGAYALVAALVRGLFIGAAPACVKPHGYESSCKEAWPQGGYHWVNCPRPNDASLTGVAVLWPVTLPGFLFWKLVLVPWWENIVKPVAAWSERIFAKQPEGD